MSHFAVEPGAGRLDRLGGLGIHHKVSGEQTDGLFSIVEHPMNPRALAAPLHRHAREDECSFVIEGCVGAQLGDDVVYADVLTGDPRAVLDARDQPPDTVAK